MGQHSPAAWTFFDGARVVEVAVPDHLNPLRTETVSLLMRNRTGGDLRFSRIRAASCGCLKFNVEEMHVPPEQSQVLEVHVALGERNGVQRFAIDLASEERGTWRVELLVRALPVLRVADPVLVTKSGQPGTKVQQTVPFSSHAIEEVELPSDIKLVTVPSWLDAKISMQGSGLRVGDLFRRTGEILIQGEWPTAASNQAVLEVGYRIRNKDIIHKITLCRLGE